MWRTLVIIPAYNEQASIGDVIDRIRLHLPNTDIVVVDDGSADATSEVASCRSVYLLRLPYNCGIGTAMQSGYLFAHRNGYDAAVQVDGDGQHDPAQVSTLLKPIAAGQADLVIGSRFLPASAASSTRGYQSTATRRVGIAWLSLVVSSLCGQRLTDPTSGFRAAGRAAIAAFAQDYPTDYPEPEIIAPLARRGFRVVEVPVAMKERRSGTSSITALRSAYYMVKVTLAILVGVLRSSDRGNGDGS